MTLLANGRGKSPCRPCVSVLAVAGLVADLWEAAASSAPVVGGVVWSVSVGVYSGPSGGGVGRFLVDMVKVEEDVNQVSRQGACD
jgi:hypothetical protein